MGEGCYGRDFTHCYILKKRSWDSVCVRMYVCVCVCVCVNVYFFSVCVSVSVCVLVNISWCVRVRRKSKNIHT